jgi:hypothetical protein
MGAFERAAHRRRIVLVGLHDLGTRRGQRARLFRTWIPRERADREFAFAIRKD